MVELLELLSTHGNQTPGSQPGTIYYILCIICVCVYVYIDMCLYIYRWWSCSSCSRRMATRRREASQVRYTVYYMCACICMYI